MTESSKTEEKKIKLLSEDELNEKWPTMTQEERDDACLYQNLSIDFCKAHVNEINWPNFSVNPWITFGHLDKFAKHISWISICLNPKMYTDSFLYNYRLHLKWDIILAKKQLDMQLLVFLAEAFRKSSKMAEKKAFWKAVSRYQTMDLVFIKAYKRYINMKELSKNENIPLEIFEKYLDELDPEGLLTLNLPKEFFIQHADFFKSAPSVKKAMIEMQVEKKEQ